MKLTKYVFIHYMQGVHWISNYNDIIQGQYFESNIETSLKITF